MTVYRFIVSYIAPQDNLTFWRDPYHGNRPPVADAGPDQVVDAGPDGWESVALDGFGSSDPDGDELVYTVGE